MCFVGGSPASSRSTSRIQEILKRCDPTGSPGRARAGLLRWPMPAARRPDAGDSSQGRDVPEPLRCAADGTRSVERSVVGYVRATTLAHERRAMLSESMRFLAEEGRGPVDVLLGGSHP